MGKTGKQKERGKCLFKIFCNNISQVPVKVFLTGTSTFRKANL